jgi:hypothetical protein
LNNAVLEKRGHVVSADNTADEVAHPTGNTAEGIRPGDDYRKRGHDHLRNTLEQNGWKHTRKTPDGNEHWERPGKDKQETSATFKDGVFYVFSSNAQGFEPESSNSMFHSYATLEHGGDHSAAARELAEQGYGKPKPNPSESKPFPVEALSPAWAEWVTENANAKNIPCEMLALPALSAASAAISNMVLASPWDGWIEPSMVWTVVVAPSGSMKSPPFREAVRGAFEQQRKHDAIHSQDRDAYKVEERRWKVLLKAWEKDGAEGDAPTEPRRPQPQTFVLTDTTSEAVIQAAAESARGVLIANDELSQWFERQGAYKSGRGAGGDDGVWNAAFNGDFYGEGRKTTGRTSVARFSVCVAGTIQPGVLRACGTRRNQESGLLARFLPAMVEPPPPTYTGKVMPGYVENEYLSAVEKLYEVSADAAGEPVLLRFSDDAKGGFIPWHDQYGREHTAASKADPMYAAAVSKLRGYAVRIALVLTMTDWACSPSGLDNPQPTSIGVEAVQRACRIVDWFKAQWRDVLDMLSMDEGAASDEAMCWGFIMKKGGTTTVRELTHDGPGVMRGRTDAARKWLDRQVDAGLMERCPRPTGPKGGRPTEEYRVCARQDAE